MFKDVVSNIKKYGYSRESIKILEQDEIGVLKRYIDNLYSNSKTDIVMNGNVPAIANLLGNDANIDKLLEKIICNESVESILRAIIGKDYKLWQYSVRRTVKGDHGLALHQDSPGQFNISYLLTDNPDGHGATAILPMSHKLPRWASYMSWAGIYFCKPLLTVLSGKSGDIVFFLNRTWHARIYNKSVEAHDVLLIGFFPAGADYPPIDNINDVVNKLKSNKLKCLLDINQGTKKISSDRVKVVSKNEASEKINYAMSLETNKSNQSDIILAHLYVKIIVLEIFFFPTRKIYLFLLKILKLLK